MCHDLKRDSPEPNGNPMEKGDASTWLDHVLRRQSVCEKLFCLGERLGRSHMHPHAFEALTVQPAALDGAVPQRIDGKIALAAAVKKPRVHDLYAREGKRRQALLGHARKAAVGIH